MAMTNFVRKEHVVICECGTRLPIEFIEQNDYGNLTVVRVYKHTCQDRNEFRRKQLAKAQAQRDAAVLELKHYKDFMKMMKGVA